MPRQTNAREASKTLAWARNLSFPQVVTRWVNPQPALNLRFANSLTVASGRWSLTGPRAVPRNTALEPIVCDTSGEFDILARTSEKFLGLRDPTTCRGRREHIGESNGSHDKLTKIRTANARLAASGRTFGDHRRAFGKRRCDRLSHRLREVRARDRLEFRHHSQRYVRTGRLWFVGAAAHVCRTGPD